jgi:hypothetical protein
MSFNAVTFFGSGEMPSFENVTPKNTTLSKKNSDEIRLCVDMRNANKAITRERHLLPS